MIDFYGYDKCDTCRSARRWLDGRGVAYRWIGIVDRPPSGALLKKILRVGDYELRRLFNTSGQVYRRMKLKDRLGAMSVDEAVGLLSGHGKLCKRPIVTDGRRHTVGFRAEVFEVVWGGR